MVNCKVEQYSAISTVADARNCSASLPSLKPLTVASQPLPLWATRTTSHLPCPGSNPQPWGPPPLAPPPGLLQMLPELLWELAHVPVYTALAVASGRIHCWQPEPPITFLVQEAALAINNLLVTHLLRHQLCDHCQKSDSAYSPSSPDIASSLSRAPISSQIEHTHVPLLAKAMRRPEYVKTYIFFSLGSTKYLSGGDASGCRGGE